MRDYDTQEAKNRVAQMSFGEKFKYYLGYYKIHLIVGLCILVGVILFVKDIVTKDQYVMYFGLVNGETIEKEALQEDMKEVLECTGRENVQVYTDLSTTASAAQTGEMYSMLAIYLAADELDIIFTDQEGIDFLGASNALIVTEQWLTPELKELWADQIVDVKIDESAGMEDAKLVDRPAAVDIKGTKLMEMLGLDEKDHYLVMAAASERFEEVEKFCNYVYEMETK